MGNSMSRWMAIVLMTGLLSACGSGNTEADKEQAVLKAAQAAYQRKDYESARQGFQLLADRNNPRAQFFLGEMYLRGTGVPQDQARALQLETAAAERGSTEAQFTLGEMNERGLGIPKDKVQAYVWYALSATTGDEQALRRKAALETELSPQQLAEARKRESAWLAHHPSH